MAIKYKWLAGRLRELIPNYIENGINKLPTEQELCRRFKVSRQTARLALSLLEKEGLIEKKRGSGSYITGLTADPCANVIGILISDDSEYIYPGVINDIKGTLSQNGFSAKVYVTRNRIESEREILSGLLDTPPRGLIVEGSKSALPNPNVDLYRRLMKKGCAVVFLHNYYPALNDCMYVKDDNAGGSALLVKHLTGQGHTAIGGIFKSDDQQGPERFQGFVEAMRDACLPVPDERIGWFSSRDLDKLERFQDTGFLKRFVLESLESCTAVICYNDMIAYFLIKELKLAGYRLPDDMALTAFDNTYLSSSGILYFTTLTHRSHEMGNTAARMMVRKLKGSPAVPQEIPWRINLKESTSENMGLI